MQQPTLLEYKNYRDLKASLALMAIAILAYVIHHPEIGPYGGTWLGFTLGGFGFSVILVLLWYGIHKRRIPVQQERRKVRDRSSTSSPPANRLERRAPRNESTVRFTTTRQGWLSAHVYFGLSLSVIITLHTGFDFGWNVHTLAYALLMAMILTGLYGVYAYIRFPRQITDNLGSETFDELLNKISRLDERAITLSIQLSQEIREIVLVAKEGTAIGGGIMELLHPHHPACPTSLALKRLHELGKSLDAGQSRAHRELYATMLRKESLVSRARRDVALRAKLDLWLYFHVPFAIALVAALAAHILSIFFYW
jgi:hypothetical protein